MEISLLYDIGIIIIAAAVIAGIAKLLRQPLVLGYVLGGVLVGPAVLGLVKNKDIISTLSEFGIAFLLFIIGLELDIKKLKDVGVSAMLIGFLQVILSAAIGFGLGLLLGLTFIESLIIGTIISFSSTMIVVKLLSDKNELDSLHGRMMLGILVIQDVLAVLALSMATSLNHPSLGVFGLIILKGIALICIAFITTKYVLPGILKFFESSSELLFIGSLAVCFLLSEVAFLLGYSFAIGAFIAGVALTTTQFNLEIASRIRSLRDFFSVLFFVTLGMTIILTGLAQYIIPLALFLLAAILLKPLLTFWIMRLFGYGRRTAFLSSAGLGQVSEFSLILASVAFTAGLVSQSVVTITTILMVVSVILTAYVIKFDERLYQIFSRVAGPDKESRRGELVNLQKRLKNHIVLFGTYRMGMKIINFMHHEKKNFVVVDFSSERVRALIKKNVQCIYGDMGHMDIYEQLNFNDAAMVISSVHHQENNILLTKKVKKENKKVIVIVAARKASEALALYEDGADYVILADSLGGEKVVNYMKHLSPAGIREWGMKHRQSLIEEGEEELVHI